MQANGYWRVLEVEYNVAMLDAYNRIAKEFGKLNWLINFCVKIISRNSYMDKCALEIMHTFAYMAELAKN